MTDGERIGELLAQLEDQPSEAARELVRAVLELHGQALAALLSHVADDAPRLARIAQDTRVAGVLLLHGLHPVPAAERVREALRRLSGLELREVKEDEGGMRLVLACTRPARPGEALRERVEAAVFEAAPELLSLQVEGLPVQRPVIPITAVAP